MIKIAVIGGGTAGFMAAAHLTKHMPACDLYHIYDSRIPTIGVGEGTTPPFLTWLHEITSLSFAELQTSCYITHKYGIQFENWGHQYEQFSHNFFPQGSYAYHISAAKIVELLQKYVTATYLDRKVVNVNSDGRGVQIGFEGGGYLEVDYAFDARGFPKTLDESQLDLTWVPTNAALIRRGPSLAGLAATRAVARPHGWIFVIPLTVDTAYGYIHNFTLNSAADIEADFDQFLWAEQVNVARPGKWLQFPNFIRRTFFDGALFRIGNAASFLEPLEATAIGIILFQLNLASFWLFSDLLELGSSGQSDQGAIQVLNESFFNFVQEVSLFVGWHYAAGSCFETEFWQRARLNFEGALRRFEQQDILSKFDRYLQAGAGLPLSELDLVKDPQFPTSVLYAELSPQTFGGFPAASFAVLGRGLGYFSGM